MTIRKNRPPPNVVVPRRSTPTGKTAKGSTAKGKAGGVSGSSGSSKGSSQVKLGTNAFSVDHVDHADPDQKRGRQQFQNTGSQPAAESLSASAKKAVGNDGKLRRSDKASPKKKGAAVVDDDDGPDGVAMKAARAASAGVQKASVAGVKAQKTQKAADGAGAKDGGGGGEVKAEGKGKGGGHGRVERKNSGERLEANEKVSIAVESSGAGGAGGVSSEGKSVEVGELKSGEGKGEVQAGQIATTGVVAAGVVEGGGQIAELQRAGATVETKDAAFQAAVKEQPKAEVIHVAQGTERTELKPALETVSRGQMESDIQDELHAGAVDTKKPGAVETDEPFDDVARSIADDGDPIDGVLGDDASRSKAAAKGVPFVKGDGSRRGIDAPVEKAVGDMAVATGNAGVDASDIADGTKKLGKTEDGDADGEGEEEVEEDGEED